MKTKFLTLCTIALLSITFIACEKDKEETLTGKNYEATYTDEDMGAVTETIKFTSASQGTTTVKMTALGITVAVDIPFVYTYTKPNIEIITTKTEDFEAMKQKGSIEGKKLTLYDEDGISTVYTEK